MRIIVLAMAALAAGCAPGFDRGAYLGRFVGAPESEIVRAFGVPTRTFQTGEHTFLAYEERSQSYIPATPFFFGGGGFYGPRYGYGYGGGFPPEIIERACETTFDMVGGRMATWSLRGNGC